MQVYFYIVSKHWKTGNVIHNYKRGYVFANDLKDAEQKVIDRAKMHASYDDDSTYTVDLCQTDFIEL